MSHDLTARAARRIALGAQGFAEPPPGGEISPRQFRKLARRLGVIQIDSVNVVTRTHYLPAFSRLGAHPRAMLETEAWGKKPSFFEYWGHEASLIPIELQPLFRWRMERARGGETWSGLARFGRERRDYIENILKEIETRGPVTGGDFAEGRQQAGWWNWSHGKRALEWLFWAGLITTKTRRGFERVYDLTERVIPAKICNTPTPPEDEAQRQLIMISANAMGVATEGDLRDYFRLPVEGFKSRIAELVEDGQLQSVAVQGWRQGAYLAPGAKIPRKLPASALLSPFDNLIWRRERTQRMFGARIRLEIYTPAEKREHGYYVLPFLQGEAITARVDLKADRKGGVLLVQAAHLEPRAVAGEVAPALAAQLAAMSGWLGLGGVSVSKKGDLSAALLEASNSNALN
jgi:uncharacterized protein YcaQ